MLEQARVAEVFTPGDHSFGSGYLVSPNLLLTARHVVEAAVGTPSSPPGTDSQLGEHLTALGRAATRKCRVRLLSDDPGPFSDALVLWAHATVDVALLGAVAPDWTQLPSSRLTWADIAGVDPVKCTAVGFPEIEGDVEGVRDSRQIVGQITPVTGVKRRKWAISVEGSVGRDPISEHSSWSGMSGAAVFADDELVGLVEMDPDPEDPSRMELWALRAREFADDEDLVRWIQADSGPEGWRQVSAHAKRSKRSAQTHTLTPVGAPTLRSEGLQGRTGVISTAVDRLLEHQDVALVSGVPGVGKTAVASQLLQEAATSAEFSGGALWLPVGRGGPAGMTHWVHRLVNWASQLGVGADEIETARSNEDGPALCRLVNDALVDRRVLLIFDDVWEKSDAIVFKDIGRCCQRVVTTRIPEVGRVFASQLTPVEELDPESAKRLIESYSPDAISLFGPLLDEVVDNVAGVPLALVLVGMKLNTELGDFGDQAARTFLGDIRDLRSLQDLPLDIPESQASLLRGDRTLQAVIGLTTGRLSKTENEALHSLTAFPPKANSFSDAAGNVVVGEPQHLRALRSNGLLDLANPITTRWTMHQAIFDFARGNGASDEAMRRMTAFLAESYEHLSESVDSRWVYEADEDMENVRAALEWTTTSTESYLSLRLTAALWTFWYERNYFQRARDLAERALAVPMPDKPSAEHSLLRAKVLNDAGNYAWNMGDLDSAERMHNMAHTIRESLDERALVAGSLNNLGLVCRERGEYDKSLELTREALRINEETRHKRWLLWKAMNLNNIGITLDRQGLHQDALSSQLQSISVFEQLDSTWGLAMARTDMAAVLINLGRSDEARDLLLAVLKDRRSAGDDKRVAATLRGLARLADEAQATTALQWLMLSLQLSVPIFDRLGEVAALAGVVSRAAWAGRVTTGARAHGILDALVEKTGLVFSPWRINVLTTARATLHSQEPKVFSAERSKAYDAVASGQLHTLGALGWEPDDALLEAELDLLTAP